MKSERLYWSIGMPLKFMGCSLDEWVCILMGVCPGMFYINNGSLKKGIIFFLGGILICWFFKKFKSLSKNFLIFSWLVSKKLIAPPSKQYPDMLNEVIGK